ncbi:hypothetical protein [Alloyangia pacifica]|uniref:hypothetical protein n=2 Tax=Roseobacteraceae TaxID=2854170 RepID=UPI0031DC24EF
MSANAQKNRSGTFMVRKASLLQIMILLAFSVLSLSGGASPDSERIAELAESGIERGGSYGLTAQIHAMIPGSILPLVVYIVGFFFMLLCVRNIRTPLHACVMLLLIVPPSTLAIDNFQKDLLLAPFVTFAALMLGRETRPVLAVLWILLAYSLYAAFFRSYYFIIAGFFVYFYFFRQSSNFVRFLIVASLPLILMLTPVEFLVALQEPRDTVNTIRFLRGGSEISRTMFWNPVEIEGPFSFLVNYVYAALRLNLSVLFTLGLKELFLAANVAIYFFCALWTYRHGRELEKIACDLFVGHVVVLMMFEPDLGSYARHLSCTLPFAAITICAYFEAHPWRISLASNRPFHKMAGP